MGKYIDMAGQHFGRLVVVERAENTKRGQARWLCKCDCGGETIVRAYDLKSGATTSCGCYNKEQATKHGYSRTRLYRIWKTIKSRCFDVKDKDFQRYGACGITLCLEWQGESGLKRFVDWAMANGYDDKLTIDRIDNDKGYSPDNCRWVTMKEQANNRGNNRLITYKGETHTAMEWEKITGLKHNTILYRLKKGWDIAEILETAIKRSTP